MNDMDNLLAFYHNKAAHIPYGKIFLTVSNDNGRTRSVHATYVKSVGRYTNNIDAKAALGDIIDQIAAEKKNGGAIAITLMPHDGVIKQITVQPSERTAFKYADEYYEPPKGKK
jgi:hypothetical protein